ncbi:MAG: hypothetical protein KAI07_01880 [Deltaproteobacteria bacterium]|nr:hypothetical protein [Deltaproteobacteria bacterium]
MSAISQILLMEEHVRVLLHRHQHPHLHRGGDVNCNVCSSGRNGKI